MTGRKMLFGIRLKLTGAFLLVSSLMACLAIAAIVVQLRVTQRAALMEAENVANAMAYTGVSDVLHKPRFLQNYVDGWSASFKRDLTIVDMNKRVIADSSKDEVGQIFDGDAGGEVAEAIRDGRIRTFVEKNERHPEGLSLIAVPLRFNQADLSSPVVGALLLEYTPIYNQLVGVLKPYAYGLSGAGLIGVLLSGFWGLRVASRTAQPIEDLEAAVQAIAKGTYGTKVELKSSDETASLGNAFNAMSAELKRVHRQLIDYQVDLEKRMEMVAAANKRLEREIQERQKSETSLRESEERLTYLAQYDSLTELPNRHQFHDYLSHTLAVARRSGTTLGVMFVDLDRFKAVNDTFGHRLGDLLLIEVSNRLRHCVRSADVVGRLSGDEFAVLLANLAKPEDAGLVAQKMLAAVSAPIDLQGHRIHISASIGIAIFPGDGDEPDELLTNADIAMYRGKESGRNTHQFYLPQMNERTARRLQLEGDLHLALQRDEFLLHYQPKVDLKTGAIVGFEALLRWQHPKRGIVSPAEFVPVLEDTGLIDPVGAWLVQTVCAQLKQWQAQGIEPRPVAVNVSARQLLPERLQTLIAAIKASGIDTRLLKFELTESLLMRDVGEAIRALTQIKATGVRLSVDDFGTGYSSLAYLKRFPIDELKIDRAFVRDVTNDGDDAEIALAIIGLAHSLKLTVVAEGVETEAQLAFLRMHGCDEMQGYYFSKPLEANACTQALLEDRHLKLPPIGLSIETPTILIVDDNENDRELIQRALKPAGYRILTVESARAAFDTLLKESVNMVISDQHMIAMTGVEFLSKLRKLYPRTIRVAMSGSGDVETVTEAINNAGVEKFLSKNWDAAKLLAEVHEAYLAGTNA